MKTNFYAAPFSFKIALYSLFLLLLHQGALGQVAPAVRWDKTFGGTEIDNIRVLIPTHDGGYMAGGFSFSGQSGDRSDPNRGSSTSTATADFWIIKTDAAGNKQWDRAYGGNNTDILTDLKQTPDGGYVLGGFTHSGKSGDVSGDPVGYPDYWIVRIDPAGNKLWDRVLTSYGHNNFRSLVLTPDGGVLVAGSSDGGWANRLSPPKGKHDFWLVKLADTGKIVWEKSIGGSSEDHLEAVVATNDGNFLLCGYSVSGTSGDKTQVSRGWYDYWIVKVDPAGNKLWDKTFGGSGSDQLLAAVQTLDGGYLLGGYSGSGISGEKTQAGQGMVDYWIVKTDAAGNKLWDKTFGGNANDHLSALLQLTDGGYLLVGSTESEPSGNRIQPLQGMSDFWIVRTDAEGTLLWERTLGGAAYEWAHTVTNAWDGGYLLGGQTTSDPSGNKTGISRGKTDGWLVNLNKEGTSMMSQLPAVTTTAGEAAFTEGFDVASTPIVIDPLLTLADPDNDAFFSAIVKITGGHQPKEDVLAFLSPAGNTGNISATYDPETGVLLLHSDDASATVVQWQEALRSVVYTNTSDAPALTPRTVSFSVSDGDAASLPASRTITITATNDTPTSLTLSTHKVQENVPAGTTIGSFTATDPDAQEQFTFLLASGDGNADNQAFTIDGKNLRINASPDYETKQEYHIRVAVLDAGGLAYEETFTITITDADEIPPVGYFTINYDDEYTNQSTVTLSVNPGDATSIRVSNDGINWGYWYTIYNNVTYYNLPLGDGLKTLYLQLRDKAGNISETYTDQIIMDQTKPLPVLSTSSTSPTSTHPLPVEINFGETVTGFDKSDVVVTGGILEHFAGSGAQYSFSIMPTAKGNVTITVPAGVAKDLAENTNRAAAPLTVQYEGILRPAVTTAPASNVRTTSATVGGSITSDGGAPVLERGVMISTDLDILIPATKVVAGSGTGSYSLELTDLSPGTTYYVEAYATNEAGTTYGEELTFTTPQAPARLLNISKGQSDRDPTNATNIHFRVTFDRSITGLKTSNFRLETSGVTGSTILGVSGSGSIYIVTVSSGTGSGTIRLVMENDLGMSIGIANLPFTAGFEYMIDKDPPVVAGVAPNGIYNTDRLITFNEGTATIVSTSASRATAFESGTTLSEHADYVLKVTDIAGNITSLYFSIDKMPPTVIGVADGASYNKEVTIGIYGGTATLNGSPYTSGTPVSAEGDYILQTNDIAGNTQTIQFSIDKTPPSGQLAIVKGSAYTNTTTIQLAIEAKGASYMMLYNEGYQGSATSIAVTDSLLWTLSGGSGEKRVFLQLFDAAGNQSPVYEATIILDSQAPTVTLSNLSPQATGSLIPIEIVFSEPVTGFTVDDIEVNGASKGNFSGDGSHYRLELQTSHASSIQVQVPASVVTDIAGNGNSAAIPLYLTNVTAIDDLAEQASLQVYPNPVQGSSQVYIRLEGGRGRMLHLKLYDSLGQLLLERACPMSNGALIEYGIPLNGLAKGVYYLFISDARARSIKKVVVR